MTARAVQSVKRKSSSVAGGMSAVQEGQVEEITRRVDYARETRMFHKIVALVAAGMLMDSVVAVYAPELFATKVRFRCVGLANAVAKLPNVLMPMIVGGMLVAVGTDSVFVAIAVVAVIAMLVTGVFGVETSRRSIG